MFNRGRIEELEKTIAALKKELAEEKQKNAELQEKLKVALSNYSPKIQLAYQQLEELKGFSKKEEKEDKNLFHQTLHAYVHGWDRDRVKAPFDHSVNAYCTVVQTLDDMMGHPTWNRTDFDIHTYTSTCSLSGCLTSLRELINKMTQMMKDQLYSYDDRRIKCDVIVKDILKLQFNIEYRVGILIAEFEKRETIAYQQALREPPQPAPSAGWSCRMM